MARTKQVARKSTGGKAPPYRQKGTYYKLRSECQHDVDALFEDPVFQKNVHTYQCIQANLLGVPIPDVDVDFWSHLKIDEIRSLINKIPDAHVMSQSLNYAEKYTGERYYFGAEGSTSDEGSDVDPNKIAEKINLLTEVSSESSLVCQKHHTTKHPLPSMFEKYESVKEHWKDWVYVGADNEFSKVEPEEIEDGFLDDMDYVNKYLRLCSDDKDAFNKVVTALQPKVEKGEYTFSDDVIREIINHTGDTYLLVDKKHVIKEVDHTKEKGYGNHFLHAMVKKDHWLNSLTAHVIEYLEKYGPTF